MTITSACWKADLVPPWYLVLVNHLEDMNPEAVPPFDRFTWTGFVFIAGGETLSWLTNHQLQIRFKLLVPPTPPPKPTITLSIFNQDYRLDYGTVVSPYGPIDLDPCP